MNHTIEIDDSSNKPTSSPLGGLNHLFHQQYQRWQDAAEQQIAGGEIPIVLRLDDRLILIQGEQLHTYQINGDLYHELKALSHLPLVVYLSLADPKDDEMDINYLHDQLEKTTAMLASLDNYIEPISSAIGQLQDSLVANDGLLAYDAATQFARSLKPTFQKLIDGAATDEVSQLMSALKDIKAKVNNDLHWSETFFVICAGHQPRYKQTSKLFFERWLRQETNSHSEAVHRIIYAEGCKSLDDALKLVTTRIVSAKLGDLFLHSPLSLDEDVLGDAGKAAIDRLFIETYT